MAVEYVIREEIFALYPGYERGVVVINEVRNGARLRSWCRCYARPRPKSAGRSLWIR